ncbi:MAG: hypothetical protein KA248_12330 [Kiritimatiellae bacterium]|nr:hypothetical protein [Kiritimatiellia bacterium]
MKKLATLTLIASIGLFAGSNKADAEQVWFKGFGARYDYVKYGTWLATQIRGDIGVWPVASGHTAGAVYTDNGWKNVYWTDAKWQSNVQNPYGGLDEAWNVWLSASGPNGRYMGMPFTPFVIETAVYVRNASGQWSWDNNVGYNYRYYVLR